MRHPGLDYEIIAKEGDVSAILHYFHPAAGFVHRELPLLQGLFELFPGNDFQAFVVSLRKLDSLCTLDSARLETLLFSNLLRLGKAYFFHNQIHSSQHSFAVIWPILAR